jgi:hypothetical protein
MEKYSVSFDTPAIKVYKEGWGRLQKLNVKELCQQIKIDPSHALNIQSTGTVIPAEQILRVSPNPAQSSITVSTADGSKLTGNNKTAFISIYNYSMQAERTITINAEQRTVQLPVAQLKPGIYWVQLTRGNEKLSCSFIKE